MVVMVGASAYVVQAKAVSHVGKAKQAAGKMRPSESVEDQALGERCGNLCPDKEPPVATTYDERH